MLKLNRRSARVRTVGEDGDVTFHCGVTFLAAPGHMATLRLKRRWTWRGDAHPSGERDALRFGLESPGIDPLPLALWLDVNEGRSWGCQ